MELNVLVLECLDGLVFVEGLEMKTGVIDLDVIDNGIIETVIEVGAQSWILPNLSLLGNHRS